MRTVNLKSAAIAFISDVQIDSRYKRLSQFFVLKLHFVINNHSELIAFKIIRANQHDVRACESLANAIAVYVIEPLKTSAIKMLRSDNILVKTKN